MQVQKQELRADIIKAAEHEFVKHGYQNASLRTIAKKANTTIGNLYNYFPNKESILDEVIGDTPILYQEFIKKHESFDCSNITLDELTVESLSLLIDQFLPSFLDFDLVLSNITVILLEGCANTKYESFGQLIRKLFLDHMEEHLRNDPDDILCECTVNSCIQSIITIAKSTVSLEQKKKTLAKSLKIIFLGLIYGTDFSINVKHFSINVKQFQDSNKIN